MPITFAPYTVIFTLFVSFLPTSETARAKGRPTAPAAIVDINARSKDYKTCQTKAVSDLTAKVTDQSGFVTALNVCKTRFPGIDLYIECKKKVVSSAAKDTARDEKMKDCHRLLDRTEFTFSDPMPVGKIAELLTFAGVGLSHKTAAAQLQPKGFDCTELQDAVSKGWTGAKFLFFGDNPSHFSPPNDPQKLAFTAALGTITTIGTDRAPFARLDPDVGGGAQAFFPLGACHLGGPSGDTYQGLSLYYLLDYAAHEAVPFIGQAFYRNEKTSTMTALLSSLQSRLGPDYHLQAGPKGSRILAKVPIAKVDAEGDPKNLCSPPQGHDVLVMVYPWDDRHPDDAGQLLVANVKNLCEFGQSSARKLVP